MLEGIWVRFQKLPTWFQVVVWLMFPPALAVLVAAKSVRNARSRAVVGAAVFLVAGAIWIALLSGDAPESDFSSTQSASVARESTGTTADPQRDSSGQLDAGSPTSSASTGTVPSEPQTAESSEPDDVPSDVSKESAADDESSEPDDAPGDVSREPAVTENDSTANSTIGSDDITGDSKRAPAGPSSVKGDTLVADLLAELPVRAEQRSGYDRDLFAGWIDADGDGCDTREEVLIAESRISATTGSGCRVITGQWYSYFDAVWVTNSSELDIDHLVPLAEAWDSGAHSWDSASRRQFSNDLDDSRALIAVTASSNRSKSDRDPADWLPPDRSYHCAYVADWVVIKHRWQLSVDTAERAAIHRVIGGCGTLTTAASSQQAPALAPAPTPTPAQNPLTSATPTPAPEASTCVNINTASVDELQAIIHIGPARAESMIGLRPFPSVNAMERISGIGPARLNDIRSQGLACVG